MSARNRNLAGALLLSLGAIGSRAAIAASPVTLTVTPEAPTWRDPVHLRVAGEVDGVCGPHAELGNLLIRFDILEVDLSFTDCPLVGVAQPHPFVAEMDLGLLADRDWKIVVHDARSPDPLSTSLRVYDLPTVGVTLPGLAVAGQLIHLGITSYSNGGQASVDVRPGIVSVHYEDLVPVVEPAPPLVQTLDVDVGLLAPGDYELRVFDDTSPPRGGNPALARFPLRVWDPTRCVPDAESLCLLGGRFRVSATWRDFDGGSGAAHALAIAGNDGSGVLWFFGGDNYELTAKLVDGCAVNGEFWAFVASVTNVEYHLTIEDTVTGRTRTYGNALGVSPPLIADVQALACGA